MERYITVATKRIRTVIIVLMIAVLFVSGCGSKKTEVNSKAAEGTEMAWKEKGFVKKDIPMEQQLQMETPFYIKRVSDMQDYEPDFDYDSFTKTSSYFKDTYYTIYNYICSEGQNFVLEKRKSDMEETVTQNLFTNETEPLSGHIVAMDVIKEDDIALLFVDGTEAYYYIRLDAEGNIISKIDVTKAYQKEGIAESNISQGVWFSDADGFTYLFTEDRQGVRVFNAEGTMLINKDFSDGSNSPLTTAFHMTDGSLILVQAQSRSLSSTLMWFEADKKTFKTLATLPGVSIKQIDVQNDGFIYYSAEGKLIKWDYNTGECNVLFHCSVNDINASKACHVSLTDNGEIILYTKDEDAVTMYALSDEEIKTDNVITMAPFGNDLYITTAVNKYNGQHREMPIKTISDIDWTRIMAEIVAGRGPDIMVFAGRYDDEYYTLCEKGVLEDLTGYISEDILAQIFPGIIETGTYEGKLVGIVPSMSASVMVTSKEVWDKPTWDFDDIKQILENNEEIEGMFISSMNYLSANTNLWYMMQHINTSPFLDMKNNKCYFDSKEYKDLLEMCKKYGVNRLLEEGWEEVQWIKEGRALAIEVQPYSMYNGFMDIKKQYGDSVQFVGYPGQEGYTGHVGGMRIVVNKNSKYKEEIKGFLEYILSEEYQHAYVAPSVREDVVRSHIVIDEYSGGWVYQCGFGEMRGVIGFDRPDGTSYEEEYISVLRNLGPADENIDRTVWYNMMSESDRYFEEDEDIDEVTRYIQRVTQLYLDEIKD